MRRHPEAQQIIDRLYEACPDDSSVLDDLMVKAGILWRCSHKNEVRVCNFYNGEDSPVCGECGEKRGDS